jgi:hypothetical protein
MRRVRRHLSRRRVVTPEAINLTFIAAAFFVAGSCAAAWRAGFLRSPLPRSASTLQQAGPQANGATMIFDVLANGEVIGRICIYKANAAPVGSP